MHILALIDSRIFSIRGYIQAFYIEIYPIFTVILNLVHNILFKGRIRIFSIRVLNRIFSIRDRIKMIPYRPIQRPNEDTSVKGLNVAVSSPYAI